MTIELIENLIKPIQADKATGNDLRTTADLLPIYQQAKDARHQARNIERLQQQGKQTTALPNWQAVFLHCKDILYYHSKDLEVVCWLIESLIRLQGFAGLSQGFQLAFELVSLYWQDLYPVPDEDGIITKITSIIGLNGELNDGTLILPIAMTPLTQGQTIGPFALWQYQQAVELFKITDNEKYQQRIAAGACSLDMIRTAVAETSHEFFQTLEQNIVTAIDYYQQLMSLLAEKCGEEGPPSSRIKNKLNDVLFCVKELASYKPIINPQQTIMTKNNPPPNLQSALIKPKPPQSKIRSREMALSHIEQAAIYFRQAEPHSPISYTLEKIIRWSNLALPELLAECIDDKSVLQQLCRLTGIN